MSFSQIRSFRKHSEVGCALRNGSERYKRENICVFVVLVYGVGRSYDIGDIMANHYSGVPFEVSFSVWAVLIINRTLIRSATFNGYIFAMACPGRLNPWDMLTVTRHSSFSDWIFLYYLAKNMEPYLFREMLIDLANELRITEEDQPEFDESTSENDKNNQMTHALLLSGNNEESVAAIDEPDSEKV